MARSFKLQHVLKNKKKTGSVCKVVNTLDGKGYVKYWNTGVCTGKVV